MKEIRVSLLALTVSVGLSGGFALANEPPVTTVPSNQSVAVHTDLIITGTSVNDRDGDLKEIELSVANGRISVPAGGSVTIGTSSSGKKLTLTSSSSGITRQADFNSMLASFKYKGDPAFSGKDTLTVLARDDTGATHSRDIEITVTNAPIISIPGPQEVDEDNPLSLPGISVKDETSDLLHAELVVGNGKLLATPVGSATAAATANGLKLGSSNPGTRQSDINNTLTTLIYKPNLNFKARDELKVIGTDVVGNKTESTLEILVKEVSAKGRCLSYKKAKNEGTNIGDFLNNFSIGSVASYSVVRYNLADKKSSLNSQAIGFGPALRWYPSSQLEQAGTDNIEDVPDACRANTEDFLDYFKAPVGEMPKISSAFSIAPTFYVFKDKNADDLGTQLGLNLAFLNDIFTVGVGWNISGADAGEWFVVVGPSFGFNF